ncbi:Non-specific serine/threonine protein kinase protein [Dioscorea alata]|uniref:Non-specific serine/threonine protein kinase protein n=1 Tax=Dioscorea alata TaxID=55571 RepID=A0ACB7UBE7_DIOAL|nr:Non-specific serine/threonine protein kinase protein [Dioscorea alata]
MANIKAIATLFFTLTIFSYLSPKASSLTPEQEKQTLLQLKNFWRNPTSLQSWKDNKKSSTTAHCNWFGITCSSDGFITNISLPNQNIYGPIPDSLCNLTNLTHINLYNNSISGQFPKSLYNCSNLEYLNLGQNYLVGTIPSDINRISSSLVYLSLEANNFSGDIPPGIGQLPNIQSLILNNNLFNGSFPAELGQLSSLQTLWLAYNPFTPATIPQEFGKLKNLRFLWMTKANLVGNIPDSFSKLSALQHLDLSINNLTGVLPSEFGKHSKLWEFDVSNNRISGELPAGLCAGGTLTSVVAFNNNLTGRLPDSLNHCVTLDNIQVYNNKLTGDVPSRMWSAMNLTTVMMHDNQLSGTLPEKLPWNISRLQIANNRFSGKIPSTAGNLQVFEAANNQFSGEIPGNLSSFSRLQTLSLRGNQISGGIPGSISALRFVNILDLSDNHLSGEIPAGIGSLPSLTKLDLSGNELTGEIPQKMSELKLTFLNLSSNQLSGEVPAGLRSGAYDESFLANPGLCSPSTVLNLRACGGQSAGKNHTSVALILSFVFGGLALLGTALFAIRVIRDYKRRIDRIDLGPWKLTSFHSLDFTEERILKGLTEENLIGSGGGGQVYKIVLRAGEIVAVKKIRNSKKLDSRRENEFQAKVQILGTIRQANIVKLIACISNGVSKLLVYEYMHNKSLDRWLHAKHRSESRENVKLDWPTRLSIAIGAAKGLCYMHNDCNPAVVHSDVKSSNILLDDEFGAKIADFGLARMLVNANEPESVSIVAGSIGYMAPECGYTRKVNEKVDVYGFGVVLLELTTGREARDGGDEGSLADWAWQHFQDSNQLIDGIIDDEIKNPAYVHEIETVFKLGILCTGKTPSMRPTMKQVLQVLEMARFRSITRIGPDRDFLLYSRT